MLFVGLLALMGQNPISSLVVGVVMLGFYVPMSYFMDRFFYQRYLRKEAQKRAERGGAAHRRAPVRRAEPVEVRMLTVGQIAENCFLLRRDGSDRALILDPGR